MFPSYPPEYKSKSATAQEAHEAIRPTSVAREPESVKNFLEPAMYRLYNLIWQRFVASQMEAAIYDTLQVEVTGAVNDHEYFFGHQARMCGSRASWQSTRRPAMKIPGARRTKRMPRSRPAWPRAKPRNW